MFQTILSHPHLLLASPHTIPNSIGHIPRFHNFTLEIAPVMQQLGKASLVREPQTTVPGPEEMLQTTTCGRSKSMTPNGATMPYCRTFARQRHSTATQRNQMQLFMASMVQCIIIRSPLAVPPANIPCRTTYMLHGLQLASRRLQMAIQGHRLDSPSSSKTGITLNGNWPARRTRLAASK